MIASLVLAWAAITLSIGRAAPASENATSYVCKSQGLLQPDQPGPPQHTGGGLPVCPQYSCSCCTRATVLSILRQLAPGLGTAGEGSEGSLSAKCADMTTLMACRVCDPEVGLGLKPTVCAATCGLWHRACASDYFTFDTRSGQMLACPAGGPGPGNAPCVKVSDMAADGAQFCELAGLQVSESQPCFDGTDPTPLRRLPQGMCASPTAGSPRRSARSKGSKSGQGSAAGDEAWELGGDSSNLLKWGVVLMLLSYLMFRLKGLVIGGPRGRFARPGG
mmetsp:Transcript_7324/g.18166  ORF Transcript_7324/g.18166 Transcript_7324/m.18166 type:complete len:277 (-) Transcript_7324:161-991(-)|eukprot:CAMPEP_0202878574 /NCGR_PEP_ID=MMETSP1391-20130828/32384_1 /ASSEMBLY_ACC=CAM_ASM_000867 /TAXON_ID=1034604 /ORGANISM="Chlamydomonas leiostraca, Strain SAG 11-49" /LENGTH=276 /DNA_ID=CAMNT_0049560777 /DNA_START=72 /DNA_END=902 /DNA_ORIENTATION=+